MKLTHISPVRNATLALFGAFVLAGCGGGAETAQNPLTSGNNAGPSYSGPVPATADIQAFRVEFWEKIRGTDRCGNCHNATGQSPSFARSDDVNAAYQQAQAIVNRENPAQSPLVLKVATGGHNCWLPDAPSCGTILSRWIAAWVGASATGGRQIQLRPPEPRDPGASRRFPAAPPAEFDQLYGLLDQYCSGCHQADSDTAQQPYFAAGARPFVAAGLNPLDSHPQPIADQLAAYVAAIPKINLDDPVTVSSPDVRSRLVLRLRDESHQCWSNCAANAAEMLAAINRLAGAIPLDPIDPSLVLSKALTMYEGTVASGGNRYENSQIALYEFKTGMGPLAFDTSGVDPAADLSLMGTERTDYEWVGGWGLMFKTRNGRAQAEPAQSRKFHQLIGATGEYSIEAWVVPANVTQEDAYIISYSGGNDRRNFTLGQTVYNYDFLNRSTATPGLNGTPQLSTDDDDERLQATLQHVVLTFDPVNGRRIYVNGEFTGDVDSRGGGTLGDWDDSFVFLLGNEASGDRPWAGTVRLAAVHNRALTAAQIQQNFEAGVGQKFFMLFGISHIVDEVPQAYIVFEASQYDSAGYLFTNPKFISLDPNAVPSGIELRGMRIGLNGSEPLVGQAYRLLDAEITSTNYSAATGYTLSTVGTIISLEQGPERDEFFLCFDQLGDRANVCSTYANVAAPSRQITAGADIGVRTFDEINATFAKLTGVDPNTTSIRELFNASRQSLPATADISAFLGSHQSSVAQLAIQYCHVMTDNPTLRTEFFGSGFNFGTTLTTSNAGALIDPVINRVMNTGLMTQPNAPDVYTAAVLTPTPNVVTTPLDILIHDLCHHDAGGCPASPGPSQVSNIVAAKAVCAAVLGSAVTLVK